MNEIFNEENLYLQGVKTELNRTLSEMNRQVLRYETEFKESMKYLWENRSGMDSMEIFSNERSVTQIVNTGEFTVKQRAVIEKLMDSPYFARLDFQHEDDSEAEAFYIGRFAFVDEKGNLLIHDWRAPISSLYYDFELGTAYFEAPIGRIKGYMTLKRQFKIKQGQMEYAFESGISIHDEVLQKELSHTSDLKMKNIVATIQKEQNQIIRSEDSEVLIIQGVAGSGKTSIALHRIAYLLYKYQKRLSAENVVIVSPNKVFADYISNVLPELGEEPILETSFENMALELLGEGISFEGVELQVEKLIEGKDSGYLNRMKTKASMAFLSLLDEYVQTNLQEKKNISSHYKSFFEFIQRPDLLALKEGKQLEWADVYPLIYLKIHFEGVKAYEGIKHLIIDEMQDYTPVQYAVVNKLFSCPKTILGDFGQAVNPYHRMSQSLFETLFQKMKFVKLNKSYRSTFEIIKFAEKIQDHEIEPVERHGEVPQIIQLKSCLHEVSQIKALIEVFEEKSYTTLGIICRSKKQAEILYKELVKTCKVNLIDSNTKNFSKGVTLTSVHMAKGLEFDEVIVPSVSAEYYYSEHDKSLLYIACTRAMHKLTLTYEGQRSELLG